MSESHKEGNLAVLKEDHQIAMHWNLVRVIAVHPGHINIIRVITIHNSAGEEFRCTVINVAALPTPTYEEYNWVLKL